MRFQNFLFKRFFAFQLSFSFLVHHQLWFNRDVSFGGDLQLLLIPTRSTEQQPTQPQTAVPAIGVDLVSIHRQMGESSFSVYIRNKAVFLIRLQLFISQFLHFESFPIFAEKLPLYASTKNIPFTNTSY